MGKNKAKTAISVAVEAKPEVEIWRRPKNQLLYPSFLFTPSDSFLLGRTVSPQYKTSQMTTDDRQTDDTVWSTIVWSANEKLLHANKKVYEMPAMSNVDQVQARINIRLGGMLNAVPVLFISSMVSQQNCRLA